MASVLFVQGNYDKDHPYDHSPWMPIALVELATFIREKGGHKVKIVDRNIEYDNEKFKRILKEFNPDIVGSTCYTSPVIKDVKDIAKMTKEHSKAMMIVGGVHTIETKSLLDYEYIDYIVKGEGEYPLIEICELIDKKKTTKTNMLKIKNVNYNEVRPYIDLRDLPVPDYDLLDIKKYPLATFYTTRGCPGRCTFCYNLKRQIRMYDADKVIQTMTHVITKYNIREFTIADDNFANLSKRTARILKALEKYNVVFHIFLRVDQSHDTVLKRLKKAGCWAIQFGFESGSQRVLDFLNKDVEVQQNIDAIKRCKKNNIFVDGSFMIGLPTETVKEMNETVRFIKKFKPDAVDIKHYKPYPGTELFEYCIKHYGLKRPTTLDGWIDFCNFRKGEPNVSEIPTKVLLQTIKEMSKTSYKTYIKKALLLIFGGHLKYVTHKTKKILMQKFNLIHYSEKIDVEGD